MNRFTYVTLIFVSIVFCSTRLLAQEVITEGKIAYEISFPDMEMDQTYKELNPTGSIVYFKDHRSRTELTIGQGLHTASILNAETGEIITLTDMMGTKNAMIIEDQNKNKLNSKTKDDSTSPQITYLDEIKEIAGFSCKKAIVKFANENDSVEIFYTEKINAVMQLNKDWIGFYGFPLQYTLVANGMVMMMTAQKVSDEKVNESFFRIPADYQIITVEQMRRMMQEKGK